MRYITTGERAQNKMASGCQRAPTRSSMCLDERIKLKYEGGGNLVKVSLFNEAMALHEAAMDGVVYKVVDMYHARWMV